MKRKCKHVLYVLILLCALYGASDATLKEMAPLPFEGFEDAERIV